MELSNSKVEQNSGPFYRLYAKGGHLPEGTQANTRAWVCTLPNEALKAFQIPIVQLFV